MINEVKITVITVCFNSASTIKDTINSVLSQTHQNIEYIIVDGASTDNTLDIIKSYNEKLTYISETDGGIYDAMNKGIALATGDIIGTLNADDFYANETVVKDVTRVFLDPKVEACFGNLVYVNQMDTDKIVRYWKSRDYASGLFELGWMPAHPTFFARKSVYERLGGFNLDYKIAADFELLFRFLEQNKIKSVYLPKVMVRMRVGGETNKSLFNIFKQNREIVSILRKQYPDFSVLRFIFQKLINRSFQFLQRPK